MPTTMLSEHFTLAEFTYSQTASREGIDNTPTPEAMTNLERLADVMELIREICGSHPVTVTSGYRSPELNAATGGSSTSAHMVGLGCDFIIPAFGTPLDVCKAIEPHLAELGIDQCIWEYADWIHVGLCTGTPRCQCLTISNSGTSEGF
jgi:hypothetical protein